MPQEQTKHEARNYHRTQMKRELIIQKLPGTGMQNNQTETDSARYYPGRGVLLL